MRLRCFHSMLLLSVISLLLATAAGAGTYAVTNLDDSGPGSLRQAILDSNSEAGPAGIVIDTAVVTGTIELQSVLPFMTDAVTFYILGSRPIVVDANQHGPVFQFAGTDQEYEILGPLGITGGYTTDGGAGITDDGGGIWVSGSATLLLEDVSIYENFADHGWGGGIYGKYGSSVTIRRSRIWNNVADRAAGVFVGGNTVIEQSTIDGNVATVPELAGSGGGIYAGGNLTLLESTIANNRGVELGTSISAGGGIALGHQSEFTMFHSTIVANQAGMGPGIDVHPDAVINLSAGNIVAGNVDVDTGQVSNCRNEPAPPNLNNLSDDDSCGFTGASDLQNTDPMLTSLLWAGGPTPTMVPLEGSPVIDAADNFFCIEIDQRGFPRPEDGDQDGSFICDIGSTEYTPGFDDMFEIHADGFDSGDTSGWSTAVN